MTTAADTALQYWRMAQSSPIGIGLRVTDAAAAKRQLYAARAKANDPTLHTIAIRTSPLAPSTELWLVRDRNAEARAVAEANAAEAPTTPQL